MLVKRFLIEAFHAAHQVDITLDHRERCPQLMADIRQQTLLGCKKRFKPFQCLIERADQVANLIVLGAAVGNAAGEVIGAVDLLDGFGDRSQAA